MTIIYLYINRRNNKKNRSRYSLSTPANCFVGFLLTLGVGVYRSLYCVCVIHHASLCCMRHALSKTTTTKRVLPQHEQQPKASTEKISPTTTQQQ